MKEVEEFADSRQKSWCIHCGKLLADAKQTRDHVPTKTLLHQPFPANLPIVMICDPCNQGFAKDEQYLVAMLGAISAGSTDPNGQENENAARILRNNHELRAQIDASLTHDTAPDGRPLLIWNVDLKRVNRVVIKNARGHAFYELSEPLLNDPDFLQVKPFIAMTNDERTAFEDEPLFTVWPEVGSRMMTRVMAGHDLQGSWVVVQDRVYRYSVTQDDGVRVRIVIGEYLACEIVWS